MMDYKAMTTSMASNLNLLSVSSSYSVDATMYCQMIYLTNTRPDLYFAVNTMRHIHLMVAKHAVRYLKGTIDIMGSSMRRIRRLTWRVMWIRIGQEVPLI